MARRTRGISEFFFVPRCLPTSPAVEQVSITTKLLSLFGFASVASSPDSSTSCCDDSAVVDSTMEDEKPSVAKKSLLALPYLPPFVTITISGWLSQSEDITEPWKCLSQPMEDETTDMTKCFLNGEHFSLCWETEELFAVGRALEELIAREAVGWAAVEALKLTVMAGLMSAMIWPAVRRCGGGEGNFFVNSHDSP